MSYLSCYFFSFSLPTGEGTKAAISLPKAKGVKLSVIEERDAAASGKKKE